MRSRPMGPRDLPALMEIYSRLGYEYDGGFPEFLSREFEAVEVVVDADDRPLAVCGAKRAVEMVMVCDPARPVLVRLTAIALLHERLRTVLHALGYKDATAFLPPEIVNTHGRTMQKRFGWIPAWKAYRVT